jgi:hypothetical protein
METQSELFTLPVSAHDAPPLAAIESRTLKRAGCAEMAFHIARQFIGEDRRAVIAFLVHQAQRGPRILALMGWIATAARLRGWPAALGAETLRGYLRFKVRGFALHNNLSPFYIATLAALRPELASLLTCEALLPKKLLALGWMPAQKGGPRHD